MKENREGGKDASNISKDNNQIILQGEELLDALANLYESAQIEKLGEDIVIEELKEKEILEIEKLCGKKMWGFRKVVKFNDVKHICTTHGQKFERLMKQKTIETEDFIQLVNVLTNYTKLEFQPYDATKNRSEALLYYKDDSYEIVMKLITGGKSLR